MSVPSVGNVFADPEVSLLVLVTSAVVGRVLLSWLPAGRIGGHAPRELLATWAASHLLGIAWATACVRLGPSSLGVGLVIPALAFVARVLTLPAGLVPRHAPDPLRSSLAVRVVVAITVLAAAVASARIDPDAPGLLRGATAAAAVILANDALAVARVPSAVRAGALVAIAAAVALMPHGNVADPFPDSIGAAGIAVGVVGWIRHGDRRALAIASAGVAYLVSSLTRTDRALALAVPFIVTICTPAPSRRRAFAWLAGAWLIATGVDSVEGRAIFDWTTSERMGVTLDVALLVLLNAGLVATILLQRRRSAPTWNPSGARPGHEARALAFAALTAVVATGLAGARAWDRTPATSWLALLVATAIFLARALERPRTT